MELNNNELEHIKSIMEERGTIHCKFCAELYIKIVDAISQKSEVEK